MEEVYENAFSEVYEILTHMPISYVSKLPKKFLEFIEENRNKEYVYHADMSKSISEQDISIETKAILSNLYRDFWASKEEKKEIIEREAKEREKYQKEIEEKYSYDNLFKGRKKEENAIEETTSIVEYKESIFTKIINKIKSIFHIK